MNEKELQSEIVSSTWGSSWVGVARPGDRLDPDYRRRRAAWARWVMTSLRQYTGAGDRSYIGVKLEGSFWDPSGKSAFLDPHIEIPDWVLLRPDAGFPDRLALYGNGLSFPWWLRDEVTAVKRGLWNNKKGSIDDVRDQLEKRREGMVTGLKTLGTQLAGQWKEIEALMVENPRELKDLACSDFNSQEVAAWVPGLKEMQIHVNFDAKLRDGAQDYAGRRVGVWQVTGTNSDGAPWSFGVVTPRLTTHSQFEDKLFSVETEALGALFVRGLQLLRFGEEKLGIKGEAARQKKTRKAHLKAVPARVGQNIPEASEENCVAFIHDYSEAEDAWEALETFKEHSQIMLTVHKEAFINAHRNAKRHLRKLVDIRREDINVLLPVAWDSQNRVVRMTYTRAKEEVTD